MLLSDNSFVKIQFKQTDLINSSEVKKKFEKGDI